MKAETKQVQHPRIIQDGWTLDPKYSPLAWGQASRYFPRPMGSAALGGREGTTGATA